MAKLSPENIGRLKELVRDGVQVLQECEDLKAGLGDTVKAIAEELDVKPAQLNKLIRAVQKGTMNDQREAFDELDELYKAGGLG
jgi:transposase-like protein